MVEWPVVAYHGYGNGYRKRYANALQAADTENALEIKQQIIRWWDAVWACFNLDSDYLDQYPHTYLSEHLKKLPESCKLIHFLDPAVFGFTEVEIEVLALLMAGRHPEAQRLTCWLGQAVAEIILDISNSVHKRDAAWALIHEDFFAREVCMSCLGLSADSASQKKLFFDWMTFCKKHIERCSYKSERVEFRSGFDSWGTLAEQDANHFRNPLDARAGAHWQPISTDCLNWVFSFIDTEPSLFCELCSAIDYPPILSHLLYRNEFFGNVERLANVLKLASAIAHTQDEHRTSWAGCSLHLQVLSLVITQTEDVCRLLSNSSRQIDQVPCVLHESVVEVWKSIFAVLKTRSDCQIVVDLLSIRLIQDLRYEVVPLFGVYDAKNQVLELIETEFDFSVRSIEGYEFERSLWHLYRIPFAGDVLSNVDVAMFDSWVKGTHLSPQPLNFSDWFAARAVLKNKQPEKVWNQIWDLYALQKEAEYWHRPEFDKYHTWTWLRLGLIVLNMWLGQDQIMRDKELESFTQQLICEVKSVYLHSHHLDREQLMLQLLVFLVEYAKIEHPWLTHYCDELFQFLSGDLSLIEKVLAANVKRVIHS